MPALVARSGAISPSTGNKIRVRKESLIGEYNLRREVLHGSKEVRAIEASKLTDITGAAEIRSTSKSLLLLKERVNRLGSGVGTGIGDDYHASPRVLDHKTMHQASLCNTAPAPRLNRQASQNEMKSRLQTIQRKVLEMQENSADSPTVVRTPGLYSPQVLGAYNWAKEQEASMKQEVTTADDSKASLEQRSLNQFNATNNSVAMPRLVQVFWRNTKIHYNGSENLFAYV